MEIFIYSILALAVMTISFLAFKKNKEKKITLDSTSQLLKVAKTIQENKIVIFDFSKTSELHKEKYLNFIYGVCFAKNIEPEWVDKDTLVIDASLNDDNDGDTKQSVKIHKIA